MALQYVLPDTEWFTGAMIKMPTSSGVHIYWANVTVLTVPLGVPNQTMEW